MLKYRGLEIRAKGRTLYGVAAPFDSPTSIGGQQEVIRRGAFAASLASGADVLALADHDPTRLLARTSAGTLRLAEGTAGLEFSLDVPRTTLGEDTLALAEARNLGGVSVGFWPVQTRNQGGVRELLAVDLVEISIVSSFPAYQDTSVQVRARATAAGRRAVYRLRALG